MIEVHFINAGYGDASLILQKEPDGLQFSMLIDCGGETTGNDNPDGFRITAAEYLKTLGIRKIDIVILSHLHLDHSGGICAIAENFTVGELWTNYMIDECFWNKEIQISEDLYQGPENLLKSLGIYTKALKILQSNKTVICVFTTGFTKVCPFGEIRILAGNPALFARQAEILDHTFAENAANAPLCELDGFINNTSLRVELGFPGAVFLFAGDINASEWEKEIVSQADVVKLPHHGHADALNEAIAQKLKSKYTIISVSNTRTDHCPNPQIVEMLKAAGSCVLFTDAVRTANCPNGRKHHSIVFTLNAGGKLALNFI